jgi:lysozyme family protein
MPTYNSYWPAIAKRWDNMEVHKNFTPIAKRILAGKSQYQIAESLTGVPWYLIGLLHMRESDLDFNTQLAQGDPLHKKSTHVPRGRGPFPTWSSGAYDALVTLKGWNKIKDWRLEKILYYSELYNGWGYYNHGVPSAYVWAGTNIYKGGKYIADGVWSSSAVDQQPGVAGVLKAMMVLDSSIDPKRESNVTTHVTGTGLVATAGIGASIAAPHLWPWIALGCLTTLVVGGLLYYFLMKRKTNV